MNDARRPPGLLACELPCLSERVEARPNNLSRIPSGPSSGGTPPTSLSRQAVCFWRRIIARRDQATARPATVRHRSAIAEAVLAAVTNQQESLGDLGGARIEPGMEVSLIKRGTYRVDSPCWYLANPLRQGLLKYGLALSRHSAAKGWRFTIPPTFHRRNRRTVAESATCSATRASTPAQFETNYVRTFARRRNKGCSFLNDFGGAARI